MKGETLPENEDRDSKVGRKDDAEEPPRSAKAQPNRILRYAEV